MKIETEYFVYCVHCGDEMKIVMEKTVGIRPQPNTHHWLVEPCECQPPADTANAEGLLMQEGEQ